MYISHACVCMCVQIRMLFVVAELCFVMKGSHLQVPQFKRNLKVTVLRTP